MDNRPLESWYRDKCFRNPHCLIRVVAPDHDGLATCFKEYVTDAGRIDLLIAIRYMLIAVEFKREVADEGAVAQVLRYRGALDRFFPVWCIVAAPGFTKAAKLVAAASMECVLLEMSTSVNFHIVNFHIAAPYETKPAPEDLRSIVYPESAAR